MKFLNSLTNVNAMIDFTPKRFQSALPFFLNYIHPTYTHTHMYIRAYSWGNEYVNIAAFHFIVHSELRPCIRVFTPLSSGEQIARKQVNKVRAGVRALWRCYTRTILKHSPQIHRKIDWLWRCCRWRAATAVPAMQLFPFRKTKSKSNEIKKKQMLRSNGIAEKCYSLFGCCDAE